MHTMKTINLIAHWDAKADVWCAWSDDVPGLLAEGPDLEGLQTIVSAITPELLWVNLGLEGPFVINLIVKH